MSYNLVNVDPLLLTASFDASGVVDLAYEGSDLTAYGDEVLDELDEGHSVQIRVADFAHAGQDRDVYVFEVDASGGLSAAWTRSGNAAVSGVTTYSAAPKDVEVVVMAVLDGAGAPSPSTKTEAQQSGAGTIKIKIRRRGQYPVPSRRE